jgi:sulfite reductase (NADPH) hemoprotein beta-component
VAAVDDPKTLGRARLSFADEAEIDEFVATLDKFEKGEITPDQWRAYRLVRGTYGQRQPEGQMVRVKIPQGILDGDQLEALAEVAEAHSRGFGHVTTRQNLQLHFVPLHEVEPVMRRLAEAGLTTREACGNSVRNITACAWAGVSVDEPFDVTPYAEALTRYLLRHPLSSSLPRKFKIAWEGCAADHAQTPIHDLGWRARVRTVDGRTERGFRVAIGGGTAILCTSAWTLFEFLPASEILNVAEAVVRVFHRFGDYQHKQRNRMKFLIKELGKDRFRQEVDQALAEFRAAGGAALPFDPEAPTAESEPDWPRSLPPSVASLAAKVEAGAVRGPGVTPRVGRALPLAMVDGDYGRWRGTNVRPQKQDGYVAVTVTLPLGDVTSAQLRALGRLAAAYGDGTVRTTADQDLVMRWVRATDLPGLYRRLEAASLALPDANTIADVTSCPGAESCRLAVTQSRGLGRLLGDHLRARPDLVSLAEDLQIKISGCPNGCGRHHVAGIGFQGSVRRLGARVVPQYFVMVGGGVDDEGAQFGRIAAKVPARRMPDVIDRLLAVYRAERRPSETATAFFQRVDVERVKEAVADLERLTPDDAVPADFIDLGELTEFKVEAMDGECSA